MYVWSESCPHCSYKTDVGIIEMGMRASGKNWALYTYEIGENELIPQLEVRTIPELVKVCPSTEKTEEYMRKLINVRNVEGFLGSELTDL